MSATAASLPRASGLNVAAIAAPAFIVAVLAMMILPLPPIALDLLFTFNIALALVVLLVSLSAVRPLDISSFPTILLITTLMRLSLNVASTRVVLLNGHTGPDAAGKVIEAFGHFLLSGNFAVGLVVFAILVVINFVVITKGAGRIAEVSARFTLDAMPGKQMAIDADLNAGLIGEAEARRRRAEIAREADFYGSMDGASKFVRGDAIAGILVLFVNMIGGLAIGLFQHKLGLSQAVDNYVLLAIGDGLVAQIPALVISIAAGLVVSRVGTETDVGTQLVTQLAAAPKALTITGGILMVLGFIPGMPHLAFLLFGGANAYAGWWLTRAARAGSVEEKLPSAAEPAAAPEGEASWDDVVPVDVLALEVGYRLIPLVDHNQDGELLKRIKAIRRKFAQDIGFLPPTVHIRDNLELAPGGYRISLKGVAVGEGELMTNAHLAINPGRATQRLTGTATRDPAFGLPATWVDGPERERAQAAGYTVVDPATVAATHFSHVLHANAAALLGRAELQGLLEQFAKHVPKLAEDLVPKLIPLATLQKVLQNLLEDGIAIRDLRTLLETLAEHAARTQNPEELTAAARAALGRAIVHGLAGGPGELPVIVLEGELERLIAAANAQSGDALGLEPVLADLLLREATQAAAREEALGHAPVLLVPDRLRAPLARLLKRAAPGLKVLGHGEIPDARTVRVSSTLGERQ